ARSSCLSRHWCAHGRAPEYPRCREGSLMSFGGFDQQTHMPMSEINTTPLVDVMLVLLIIFIVTAPLLTHSIQIDLPKTGSTVTPEKPDIITLSLNREGALF